MRKIQSQVKPSHNRLQIYNMEVFGMYAFW